MEGTLNIKKIIFPVICIFLCRYNFQLRFLPFTAVELLQAIGICYILFLFLCKKLHISQKLSGIFIFCIFLTIISIISATRDLAGCLSLIRVIMGTFFFFGICSYITTNLYKNCKSKDLGILLDAWIFSSLCQIIITILFFINNDLYETALSYLTLDTGVEDRQNLISIRMIGLGNQFFGAGFNYSIDILVMSLLPYTNGSYIYKHSILYWIICCLIIFVGFLSARTFIIGIGCAILFLMINERRRIFSFLRNSFKIILILSVFFCTTLIFLSQYIDTIDLILEWAFEFFINVFSGDGFRSDSTDVLMTMYIFPDNLITWLFGDGRFYMPDGSYYMHTDVGFIRLIFFFGLPATILFYIYQLYFVYKIYENSNFRILKSFLLCFILLVFICNLKGFIVGDFFLIILLTYVFSVERNKKIQIKSQALK